MKEKLDHFFQAFRMNGRTVVRTMILVLSMVLVLALVGCGNDTNTDNPDDSNNPSVVDPSVDIENRVEPEPVVEPKDMEATFAKYKDVYAWLEVPDFSKILKTDHELSYPVAQHPSDRGYYLHRDLDGNNNKAGTIFSEATCEGKTINSRDLNDPVTVLYGHNQANRTMFGGLQSMMKNLDFSEQHLVYMYQKDRRVTYQIVGGVQYDTSHIIYYHDFSNADVFNSFFDQLWKETEASTNLDKDNKPVAGDKVLILSVCKNGDDYHRYLIVCKMIEDTADPSTWPLKDDAAAATGTTDTAGTTTGTKTDAKTNTTTKTDTSAKTDANK